MCYQTKKCIRCFKKIQSISGHVHNDTIAEEIRRASKGTLENILAGWCDDCYRIFFKESYLSKTTLFGFKNVRKRCQGCYGDWCIEMGLEDRKI